MTKSAIVSLLLVALTAGCAGAIGAVPSAPANTATPANLAPEPGPTSMPPVTPTIPATAPMPFVPFTLGTSVNNVVLRRDPGYLFARIALLPEGTSLTVLGRSRGGEWVLVQTPDNRSGWVFAQLLEKEGQDWASVPFIEPSTVQVLTGTVIDDAGVPISGIQFSFTQGSAPDARRNDAITDQTGTFYAFMPPDATGSWNVSYTAVSCTSNIMDANCNWKGKPYPETEVISLPLAPGTVLRFAWR